MSLSFDDASDSESEAATGSGVSYFDSDLEIDDDSLELGYDSAES